MSDHKKIIGLVGLIACGKGTVAKYLAEKYQAGTYRFSTILRDVLKRIYVPESRDNMINLSESLRQTFGQNLLAKVITEDALNDPKEIVVVEGIRRLEDIEHLKKLPNFTLVEISADPETRFQRLATRGENSDDATKTYEQFLADHKKPTEITIPAVIELATEHIINNGSRDDLAKQIDELVKKL
jgi:dephospho-CoA kinase